jgi:uncharacterized protein
MNPDPFVVTVGDLSPNQVATKPVEIVASPGWHVELSRVRGATPLRFEGDLTLTSGGLVVRGTLRGTVGHICTRCLTEWDDDVIVDVAQLVVKEGTADHGEEDYLYSGDVANLEPVLRDELLLALPLLPTCPDGCEQLVEVLDSDLNTSTPNDTGESVSPFAVLKDLLDHEQ